MLQFTESLHRHDLIWIRLPETSGIAALMLEMRKPVPQRVFRPRLITPTLASQPINNPFREGS